MTKAGVVNRIPALGSPPERSMPSKFLQTPGTGTLINDAPLHVDVP